MNDITHHARTLAACAKRLRWITARTKPADMLGWAIVWRYEEGFRLQLAGEQHEHDGWIAYSMGWATPQEVERDIELDRADEIAAEALALCVEHQTDDFTDEQLRRLSIQRESADIARKAFAAIYERWEIRQKSARTLA